jgi:hypothetical protein
MGILGKKLITGQTIFNAYWGCGLNAFRAGASEHEIFLNHLTNGANCEIMYAVIVSRRENQPILRFRYQIEGGAYKCLEHTSLKSARDRRSTASERE